MLIYRRQGFILIFTLWVLGVLTVLSVGLAAGVRQKIVVLEKLDQRNRLKGLMEGAVKFTCRYLSNQYNLSGQVFSENFKSHAFNNPNEFGRFELAKDTAIISYRLNGQEEVFGVEDEERKINLNTTTPAMLSRLLERILGLKPDLAETTAQQILDWRQVGSSQAVGFFSDEYYDNLKYPYPKKNASFETIDELLLIKGITKEVFEILIHYLTVCGNGKVNINTASAAVLYALGMDDVLIEKLMQLRQGEDHVEASGDDHIFRNAFDVASELKSVMKLNPSEIHTIDALNQQGLLTTNSYYFNISVSSHLYRGGITKKTNAIFYIRDNRIIYWKER